MHGDDAEEAVEEEQEERDERAGRSSAAVFACCSESLPSVAETSVRSICVELDRQRAGLEHEREVLRLARRADARDLARRPGDAVRERLVGVVDLRERLDLAVEDDREVLRVVWPQPGRAAYSRRA